jgi:2-iminobutanoate/2-iminopropanoate deaminase
MTMPIRSVLTPNAPRPAGHYSQAIVHGGLVFVSGQLPIVPGQGPIKPGQPMPDIETQTRLVLSHLEAILREAGSGLSGVLRCTVYVSDVALWDRVNKVYAEVFAKAGGLPPARTVVPTGPLHYGYSIELDAIAAVLDGATRGLEAGL